MNLAHWLGGQSALVVYALGFSYAAIRGPLFCGVVTLIRKAAIKNRTIVGGDYPKGQFRSELKAYFKSQTVDAFVIPTVIVFGGVASREVTPVNFLFTFVACYFFFEFWFYATHRLMHTRLFIRLHRQHHVAEIAHPLSAFSLSLPEKIINIVGIYLIPCIASFYIPFVLEGILSYYLYNTAVNVLGHSNIELFPPRYTSTPAGKFFSTATYHSIHHLRWNRHFGLFTSLFDRLGGTYDPTYPEAFAQVTRSEPLRK